MIFYSENKRLFYFNCKWWAFPPSLVKSLPLNNQRERNTELKNIFPLFLLQFSSKFLAKESSNTKQKTKASF